MTVDGGVDEVWRSRLLVVFLQGEASEAGRRSVESVKAGKPAGRRIEDRARAWALSGPLLHAVLHAVQCTAPVLAELSACSKLVEYT